MTTKPSARRAVGRLLSEPLLQLLLAGALIFGGFRLFSPPRPQPIVIDAPFVRALEARLSKRLGRPATRAELERAVDEHVNEELYVRGALALGLGRGDPIVRRRLAQKMRFIAETPAGPAPSEAELRAYLARHAERFRRRPRVSFSQVLVGRDKHRGRAALAAAAKKLAARLAQRGAADAAQLGDATLLPHRYRRRSLVRVERELGASVAKALADAPVGRWTGPVPSTYGLHFVLVEQRLAGRRARIDEVRRQVQALLLDQRRAAARKRALQRLRQRFGVALRWPQQGARVAAAR